MPVPSCPLARRAGRWPARGCWRWSRSQRRCLLLSMLSKTGVPLVDAPASRLGPLERPGTHSPARKRGNDHGRNDDQGHGPASRQRQRERKPGVGSVASLLARGSDPAMTRSVGTAIDNCAAALADWLDSVAGRAPLMSSTSASTGPAPMAPWRGCMSVAPGPRGLLATPMAASSSLRTRAGSGVSHWYLRDRPRFRAASVGWRPGGPSRLPGAAAISGSVGLHEPLRVMRRSGSLVKKCL